jgi:uncharacterized RDD family membrane protein YckC
MNPEKDYLSNIPVEDNFGYKLASPWVRLAAALLEGVIIYLPIYLFMGDDSPFYNRNSFDLETNFYQAILSGILGAIFYSLWSGNLGHKLLGLKVISSVDGSNQRNPITGAIREILKVVFGLIIIPIIWLLWDTKHQNLYDKITKTLVVSNP